MQSFEKLYQQYGVKITVDRGHRQSRIRLQGQTKDVLEVENKIKTMLYNLNAEAQQLQEAAILAQFVSKHSPIQLIHPHIALFTRYN